MGPMLGEGGEWQRNPNDYPDVIPVSLAHELHFFLNNLAIDAGMQLEEYLVIAALNAVTARAGLMFDAKIASAASSLLCDYLSRHDLPYGHLGSLSYQFNLARRGSDPEERNAANRRRG